MQYSRVFHPDVLTVRVYFIIKQTDIYNSPRPFKSFSSAANSECLTRHRPQCNLATLVLPSPDAGRSRSFYSSLHSTALCNLAPPDLASRVRHPLKKARTSMTHKQRGHFYCVDPTHVGGITLRDDRRISSLDPPLHIPQSQWKALSSSAQSETVPRWCEACATRHRKKHPAAATAARLASAAATAAAAATATTNTHGSAVVFSARCSAACTTTTWTARPRAPRASASVDAAGSRCRHPSCSTAVSGCHRSASWAP